LSFSPYSTIGSISYLPFSAFIFALTYGLYALLGEPSRFLYYFLLKQPIVWADIGAAVVLAKIILLSGDAQSSRTALLVWLYFPLGIIISSIWGQLDPISLLFSLLTIYFFSSSKWLPSAVMLGLSIYLKTLPIIFLPVFLILLRTGKKTMLGYSLICLVIPVAGTLIPAQVFNWGYQGMYNNISFQVAIPSTGAMSALGLVYLALPVPSIANYLIGSIWIPVLLATYFYIWKKDVPLILGLLITILAFSMSRPFLPEQWSLYPLAFLLLVQTRKNLGHFLGLSAAAIAFLVANNTLLVMFFTPISVSAFNWHIFVNNQSSYVLLRVIVTSLLALLYFSESFLVVLGRGSFVHRAIISVKPAWSFQKRHISPTEVSFV
jgi:hypothetical protein